MVHGDYILAEQMGTIHSIRPALYADELARGAHRGDAVLPMQNE